MDRYGLARQPAAFNFILILVAVVIIGHISVLWTADKSRASDSPIGTKELERRLSYIAFEGERRRLVGQLTESLIADLAESPFSAADWYSLFHYAVLDGNSAFASSAFEPAYRLNSGSQRARWSFAKFCVNPSLPANFAPLQERVCKEFSLLVRNGGSAARNAAHLNISLERYEALITSSVLRNGDL